MFLTTAATTQVHTDEFPVVGELLATIERTYQGARDPVRQRLREHNRRVFETPAYQERRALRAEWHTLLDECIKHMCSRSDTPASVEDIDGLAEWKHVPVGDDWSMAHMAAFRGCYNAWHTFMHFSFSS